MLLDFSDRRMIIGFSKLIGRRDRDQPAFYNLGTIPSSKFLFSAPRHKGDEEISSKVLSWNHPVCLVGAQRLEKVEQQHGGANRLPSQPANPLSMLNTELTGPMTKWALKQSRCQTLSAIRTRTFTIPFRVAKNRVRVIANIFHKQLNI